MAPLVAAFSLVATPVGSATPDTDAAEAPPRHHVGTLADGATWLADVPARWNGTLVLYGHGFGPLEAQVAHSEEARVALLDAGYAVAGSSYDPNGSWWATASAPRDQLETLEAFSRAERRPTRTIAAGESMGGLIAAQLARDSADRIDGALSLCGIAAGGVDMADYFTRGTVAIAALLLPGEPLKLGGYTDLAEAQATGQRLVDAVAAAQGTPEGRARVALAAAYLNQADWSNGAAPPAPHDAQAREAQQFAGMNEGLLNYLIWYGRHHVEAAVGGNPSGTVGVDYAALLRGSRHADVVRALYAEAGLDLHADLAAVSHYPPVQADPAARAELIRTSTVGESLAAPLLTVHGTADQLAPVEQEHSLAARVRAAGDGPLLRQAYVARPGHCTFTPAEVVASIRTIDGRVRTGVWGLTTEPWALNAAAAATGLGASAFVPYRPGRLVV